MAKKVCVKIRRVAGGPYAGQFSARRGDVCFVPRGEAQRLLNDEPDNWVPMAPNAKVSIYAQHVVDPAEGEDEYETGTLEVEPEVQPDDESEFEVATLGKPADEKKSRGR